MALFLRGDVWWMEYRTRKVRKVVSTGFRKGEKAKANAAWEAFRLGMGAKPKRTAMEGILDAIYGRDGAARDSGISLGSLSQIYEDWQRGKGRKVGADTDARRRSILRGFAEWAEARGRVRIEDVDVALARAFIDECRIRGRPGNPKPEPLHNKTLRNIAAMLGGVWTGVSQLIPGIHNPWPAVRPDDNGTSVRREVFTLEEELRVLEEARAVGHGWHLASVIARWTGQRYGDVAHLQWGDAEAARKASSLSCGVVDLGRSLIVLEPSKTRRHSIRLVLPVAEPLARELSLIPADQREGFVLSEHAFKYEQGVEPPFSEVLRRAGLDTVSYTFHSWRHTFRTRLAEAGVPDQVAMRFGWTNMAMSKHYDHASHLAELRDAVSRLSPGQCGT